MNCLYCRLFCIINKLFQKGFCLLLKNSSVSRQQNGLFKALMLKLD